MRWLSVVFLISSSVVAQESRPNFRGGIGFAGGTYHFDSDLDGFDDSANAGLFQARFEYTSARRVGGGVRFEYLATDRDEGLFSDPANPANRGTEARSSTLLAHATFRLEQHRFTMPMRVGLLVNGLILDDHSAVDPETSYWSAGPFFEIEPELVLTRRGKLEWSVYAQLGFGAGSTAIDVDGVSGNYRSTTAFGMVEAGTRMRIGKAQLGIAFIGRYQSMERSGFESNSFIFGYDSEFEGVLLTAGFSF